MPSPLLRGIVKTEDEHRRDICVVGRWIHSRAFVASTDGNISIRLDSRRVLTSPTGMSKGMMSPDDLMITDLQGRKLSGRREPSSELGMHLLIYNRRPDVHAVVHAHPPAATAHAAAGIPLAKALLSEFIDPRWAAYPSRNTARPERRNFPTRWSRWCSTMTRFCWPIMASLPAELIC